MRIIESMRRLRERGGRTETSNLEPSSREVEMRLDWIKCTDGNWCSFARVNLDHSHFVKLEGVYVIWHAGSNPATVYVGQGYISDCIKEHRNNDRILIYYHWGLLVTWAKVAVRDRNGVERFLLDHLQPKVSRKGPSVPPIHVNFPWK